MAAMRAIQVKAPGADFELVQKEIPEPKLNEVLIKVEACGICHGDVLAREGRFPGISYPRIPGHEVVGVIERIGTNVVGWNVGQRVGVGWHGGHCFQCSACRRGDYWACESSLTTGLSADGGYAEYMTARSEVLSAIPKELGSVDAAPIICAGRTTFGALKGCGAKAGDLVAIHGFGGLGHLAVQYANKMGFRTVVLSRGKDKEALARKLGAWDYIDTTAGDPAKELRARGGAKTILCTAPNGKTISELLGGLGRGGEALVITAPNDPIVIPPFVLLGGGRGIRGWIGGSVDDALEFSTAAKVTPMVEVFPLEKAKEAFDLMMSAKVHFRAVLKMS
ncbi:MAG TPA: alcohol dehydrogenase catalytic domain-containing protein [Spirochaetia bacterium]|nr:alcohol dehydrogenase catalytic domain-containing protein [Spirochaetia bacterium]